MAKDKLPKHIYFPIDDPRPSKQAEVVEMQAKKRFKELVKKRCYREIYLIFSGHWTSTGYWIEFKQQQLSSLDQMIDEHHNKNPQKWIPPPPNEPTEEDEE